MPWILPAGYRNPNERVPDFPDDDNEAGGSLGKESGSAPLTGASAEVTAANDATEDDNGFETVDDRDEEPGDKVVITISAKEVKKPEGSGLVGKTPMFESKEEDDPEIKKKIEAALDAMGLIEELMLSEQEDEQNIRLHDVISPVAMARVTVMETYIVDGIPTTIKADNAFCPFCAYTASNHRAINNHVRMHF